ncbi:unnamed protein product [Boreogadus saida]
MSMFPMPRPPDSTQAEETMTRNVKLGDDVRLRSHPGSSVLNCQTGTRIKRRILKRRRATGGWGGRSLDTAYVRVFISDVNDNRPAFARADYEVAVEEDADVGLAILTVSANDGDEGEEDELAVPT